MPQVQPDSGFLRLQFDANIRVHRRPGEVAARHSVRIQQARPRSVQSVRSVAVSYQYSVVGEWGEKPDAAVATRSGTVSPSSVGGLLPCIYSTNEKNDKTRQTRKFFRYIY